MDVFMLSFLPWKPQIHIDKSISSGCRFEDLEATEAAGFCNVLKRVILGRPWRKAFPATECLKGLAKSQNPPVNDKICWNSTPAQRLQHTTNDHFFPQRSKAQLN